MDRDALIAQLEKHEGVRLTLYVDTAGKMTIGVGRDLSDDGISYDEAIMLLDNDVAAVLDDLETFPWWGNLSDPRQRAVADLRFNVGANGFRLFKKLIHCLAVGDWLGASNEIRNSQISPARKADLAQQMEQG